MSRNNKPECDGYDASDIATALSEAQKDQDYSKSAPSLPVRHGPSGDKAGLATGGKAAVYKQSSSEAETARKGSSTPGPQDCPSAVDYAKPKYNPAEQDNWQPGARPYSKGTKE